MFGLTDAEAPDKHSKNLFPKARAGGRDYSGELSCCPVPGFVKAHIALLMRGRDEPVCVIPSAHPESPPFLSRLTLLLHFFLGVPTSALRRKVVACEEI